jgi:hypothetical protein
MLEVTTTIEPVFEKEREQDEERHAEEERD